MSELFDRFLNLFRPHYLCSKCGNLLMIIRSSVRPGSGYVVCSDCCSVYAFGRTGYEVCVRNGFELPEKFKNGFVEIFEEDDGE